MSRLLPENTVLRRGERDGENGREDDVHLAASAGSFCLFDEADGIMFASPKLRECLSREQKDVKQRDRAGQVLFHLLLIVLGLKPVWWETRVFCIGVY